MSVAELTLYLSDEPPPLNQRPVGSLKLVNLFCSQPPPRSVLDISVEAHPSSTPISLQGMNGSSKPQSIQWLDLSVSIWTSSMPYKALGSVAVDDLAALSLVPSTSRTSTLRWALSQEDVELVDRTRPADNLAPIFVQVEAQGIAKLTAEGTPLGGEPNL